MCSFTRRVAHPTIPGAPSELRLLGWGFSPLIPNVTGVLTSFARSGIPIRSRLLPVHSDSIHNQTLFRPAAALPARHSDPHRPKAA
jgi:hypothetical protein